MPKYQPRSPGLAPWIFLAIFLAALIYVAVSRPTGTAAFLLLLCGVFIASGREIKRNAEQLRCLAAEREGQSICEFAREFDAREVDTWIIRAVYEQLQLQLTHTHPAFPIRASDRLKEDLLLDDDDLDMDIAVEVEQRTGRILDGSNANPYFGKVKTVRDLVMYFQAQPKFRGSAYAVPG